MQLIQSKHEPKRRQKLITIGTRKCETGKAKEQTGQTTSGQQGNRDPYPNQKNKKVLKISFNAHNYQHQK